MPKEKKVEKKEKKKKAKTIKPPGILVDIKEFIMPPSEISLEDSYQEMLDHLSTANPSMAGNVELRVLRQEDYNAIEARLISLIEG
jgi:hypothetical protein